MTSLAHFESVARAIDLPNRAVIAGRLKTIVTGRTFDDVTLRNGAVINRVVECDAGDVDLAVAGGRRAFEDGRWRSLHYREKKRILFATSPCGSAASGNPDSVAPARSTPYINMPT